MARSKRAATLWDEPVEGPWELPEGWRWERLGSLCSYVSRGRSPKYVTTGGVPIINQRCVRWHGIDAAHSKQTDSNVASRLAPEQWIQPGDILWNSTGTGTIGRASLFTFRGRDYLADSHITIVRLREIDPRWVHRWIGTHFIQQRVAGVGSTNQVELSRDEVLNIPVPLPPARDAELHLERIDALFAEIEEGEAALAEARAGVETYRKALLKAAVTGELTADWRAKNPARKTGEDLLRRLLAERRASWEAEPKNRKKEYPQLEEPNTAELPGLPTDWCWASIDQLCSHITSGSRAWSPYYDKGDCTFVMAQNVRPGRYDATFRQLVDPPLNDPERRRTQVRQNDLLLTIVGANTGDICQVRFRPDNYFVCQSVALLRPTDGALGEMIELFLSCSFGRKVQMDELIYGAGRPHLSFDQIRRLAVPIAPVAELAAISEAVRSGLAMMPDATAISSQGGALRQSILAAAFRGNLVA